MFGLDLSDATVQFLSSFLAVLLAFGLSYWYDRREKRLQVVEAKKRILTAIVAEYKVMLKTFATYKADPNDQIGMPLTHFANTAVVSGMGSGELTLLSSASQVLIDQVNTVLNDYQDTLDRLYLLMISSHAAEPLGEAIYKRLKPILQADGNNLQEQLPETIKQLQLELDSLG